MKIAFLNLYSGKVDRGAEAFAHELARRLKESNHVDFYRGNSELLPSHNFSGPWMRKIQKRVFLDPPSREVWKFTRKHLKELKTADYNVVIPMNGFWQLFLLKLTQPFAQYKILVTGHAGPGWDERWNLYLKPDAFVATTQPVLLWAKRTAPWTRVEMIPHAVDVARFRKAEPASLQLPRPIILCPAALVPYKRVDLSIKAVSKLREGSLVVLGRGELEDKVKRMGQSMLKGRFLLTSIAHARMPAYYAAADVVTLPSSPQENSPMVFLESLAAGKPVVTTDAPRSRWILEEAGVFCNPENTDEYSRALKKAITNSGKSRTLTQIDQALKKFTWKRTLKKYKKLMEEMANEKDE